MSHRQASYLRPTSASLRRRSSPLWAGRARVATSKHVGDESKKEQASNERSDARIGDILKDGIRLGLASELPKHTMLGADVVLRNSSRLAKLFEYACSLTPMSTTVDNAKFIRTLKFFGAFRRGSVCTIDADLAFAQAKSRGRCSLNFRGFCKAVHLLSVRKYGKVMAPEHALSALLENDTQFGASREKGDDDVDYYVGVDPGKMDDHYGDGNLIGEEP